MNNNTWILPVALLAGAAAFGVAFYVMPGNKKNDPPPAFEQSAAANAGNDPVVRPKQEEAKSSEPIRDESVKVEPKKKETVKNEPTPERASYRTFKMPAPAKRSGSDYDPIEITLSDDGTHALVKSKFEVHSLNVVSGLILRTFQPPPPRYKSSFPETTSAMFLAPDASRVIVASHSELKSLSSKNRPVSKEVKEVMMYDAKSGSTLGKGSLDERSSLTDFAKAAAFTPNGDYLLLPTFYYGGGIILQAVATSSGNVSMVNVGGKNDSQRSWELTLPVPKEPKLIYYGLRDVKANPGGVYALDLSSGKEEPITALTVHPWTLNNRGVRLSPDGRLILSHGLKGFQVCDWQTGRRLLEKDTGEKQGYSNGQFTPDGKRFIIQWTPYFQFYRNGVRTTYSRIFLYDVASKNEIAKFTPEEHGLKVEINALTISRDGKTLVWGEETRVIAMDFKSMFGVDPLPPTARPAGPDVLPLK